jgi:hypothetical protein
MFILFKKQSIFDKKNSHILQGLFIFTKNKPYEISMIVNSSQTPMMLCDPSNSEQAKQLHIDL